MAVSQKSKRARKHRKEAIFAGLPAHTAHPSHLKRGRYYRHCRPLRSAQGVNR